VAREIGISDLRATAASEAHELGQQHTLLSIRTETEMCSKFPKPIIAAVICAAAVNVDAARAQDAGRYLLEFTASGDLVLVFVGSPLTPDALNNGKAGFPEYTTFKPNFECQRDK
jgi:hypothetical protein